MKKNKLLVSSYSRYYFWSCSQNGHQTAVAVYVGGRASSLHILWPRLIFFVRRKKKKILKKRQGERVEIRKKFYFYEWVVLFSLNCDLFASSSFFSFCRKAKGEKTSYDISLIQRHHFPLWFLLIIFARIWVSISVSLSLSRCLCVRSSTRVDLGCVSSV